MVAAALVHAGDQTRALQVANGVADPEKRGSVLTFVALAQARSGDMAAARETAALPGVTQDAKFLIAWLQAAAGDEATAIATARRLEDEGDRNIALYLIATHQVEAGDLSGAISTAVLIDQAASGGKDFRLALYYGAIGDFAAALDTFEPGFRPAVLGAVAAAQAKAGNAAAARQTASLILQTAATVEEPHRTAWLQVAAVTQARLGSPQAALDIVGTIRNPVWRASTLADAAHALARAGDLPQAKRFAGLTLGTAMGITGTADEDKGSLAAALINATLASASAGDVAMAVAIAQRIANPSNRSSALFAAALVRLESGDVPGALSLVASMTDEQDAMQVAQEIAHLQSSAGDHATALQSLGPVIAAALDVPNADDGGERVRRLREIAAHQVELGDAELGRNILARAVDATASIDDRWSRVTALLDVAEDQAGIGATEDASKTAMTALNLAAATAESRGMNDLPPEFTDSNQRIGCIVPEMGRFLTGPADAERASRDLMQLFESATGIAAPHCRAEMLIAVERAQFRIGDLLAAHDTLAAALHAAKQISNSQPDMVSAAHATEIQVKILVEIAKAQFEIHDAQAAEQSLEGAIGIARSIGFPEKVANVLGDIAKAQASIGAKAAAWNTAALGLEGASDLSDVPSRVAIYLATGEAQMLVGDTEGAGRSVALAMESARGIAEADKQMYLWGFLNTMISIAHSQTGHDASTTLHLAGEFAKGAAESDDWVALGTAQAEVGDRAGALATVRNIVMPNAGDPVLRKIASAQIKAGDTADATATSRMIAGPEARAQVLIEIAQASTARGAQAAASEAIAGAFTVADKLVDEVTRARVLSEIGGAQIDSGDLAAAQETFAHVLGIARALREPILRAHTLAGIVEAEARMGDRSAADDAIVLARDAALSEPNAYYSAQALTELARAQLSFDRPGALTTAATASEALHRLGATRCVARAGSPCFDLW
jgi:tetratricopeptide (TPR) repeat protein